MRLIQAGVEIDLPGAQRETALMTALRYKNNNMVLMLLNCGADPKYQAEWDQTPLSIASENCDREMLDHIKSYCVLHTE